MTSSVKAWPVFKAGMVQVPSTGAPGAGAGGPFTFKGAQTTPAMLALAQSVAPCPSETAKARSRLTVSFVGVVGSVKLLRASLKDQKPDALRTLCDAVRAKDAAAVAVLSSVTDGKGTICVACGPDAVAAGAVAGKIVKALCALTGGSGGGRPDSAMGSAKDVSKLKDAMDQAAEVILPLLSK